MSLDSDVIVDRRRIRRKLTFWRVVAALVAIAAIVTVGVIATPGGRGALTASGSIGRDNIEGLIPRAQYRRARPPPMVLSRPVRKPVPRWMRWSRIPMRGFAAW